MVPNDDSRDNGAKGSGRGGGRQGRVGRGGVGRFGPRANRPTSTLMTPSDGVPMLRYGPDNNFHKFKEKISRAAIEKFGDLGRLIETSEYHELPEVEEKDFDLDNDPRGVNLADYKEARKE